MKSTPEGTRVRCCFAEAPVYDRRSVLNFSALPGAAARSDAARRSIVNSVQKSSSVILYNPVNPVCFFVFGGRASITVKVFPEFLQGRPFKTDRPAYGVADAAGEGALIVVFVSVLFSVAGDGFTIVVLVSFFS